MCNLGFTQTNIIEPELQELLDVKGNEKISVNIILKSQIEPNKLNSSASKHLDRNSRKSFVINELKTFATKSQKDILSLLHAEEGAKNVSDITPHWLANCINCTASADVIYRLAEHPDVHIIGYNKTEYMLWDEQGEKASPTRGMTQNITHINADDVWNEGYTGKGVLIALIDSGVNYNHIDLEDHLWDGGDEYPYHGYDYVNDDKDPIDDNGHGTHCAGTICGDGTSGTQTGIAPDVTLMCLKVLDSKGSGNGNHILSAIEFAADKGADIISLSLGIRYPIASVNNILRKAFVNLLETGVVASVAAGNNRDNISKYPIPRNIDCPGNCPPPWIHPDQQTNAGGVSAVVCVGAVDYNNNPAGFSSEGPVTWQETSYKDYPYSVEMNLEEGWLYYDNNLAAETVGGISSFYWGVRFPESVMSQYNGKYLTKVSMFDEVENNGDIMIYTGGESSPGELVHTQSYSSTGSRKFVEYTLTEAIAVDASQPLWIVMSTVKGDSYPAVACKDSGNKDSRWISLDNGTTWYDLADVYGSSYSWMIRAFVSESKEAESLSTRVDDAANNSFGLIRPDISAPGVGIVSLAHNNNNGFSTMSGTSMATPCIAGVMALMLDRNPDLTPADICRLLETTAEPLSEKKNNRTGSGCVDALEAIKATPLYFTGSTSSDWNVADNWNAGVVPSKVTDNITIKTAAVIDETLNYNQISIEGNGSLTLNSDAILTLTEGIVNVNASSLIINDGAQLFQNLENVTATFNMGIIKPSIWNGQNKDGWQFVSSPFTDAELSQFITDEYYDLYKYDGKSELWLNHKQNTNNVFSSGIFDSGVGYLLAHKDKQNVALYGTLNHYNSKTWDLTYNEDENLANFHLIGNPFSFDMDWNKVSKNHIVNGYAVLNLNDDNNRGGTYVYMIDGTIKVGDAFFVKSKGENPSISYNSSKINNEEKARSINFIATGRTGSDNVIISLKGSENEGFDKLENFNDTIANIFVIKDNQRYGISYYDDKVEEIELAFDAKKMGNYTISALTDGKFEMMILIDRFTGIETDLLIEDYHFTATSNDSHNRFIVRLADNTMPSTDNIQFVYQSGEDLIITIEGEIQIIDMMGRVVYLGDVTIDNNRISISGLGNAAYIVKLINEEGVKIQKFVRK